MRLTLSAQLIFGLSICGQQAAHQSSHAHEASDSTVETTTTAQRINTEAWWPTLSTAPLDAYIGSAGCIRCHADQNAISPGTSMQRAASRAEHAALLQQVAADQTTHAANTSFAPLSYSLQASSKGVQYSVGDGSTTTSQPLDWVMGAGDLGQTFVYQQDDRWFQSRISVYTKPPQLDVTTGLKIDATANLMEALGKALTPEEVRHCFSCHTVHATSSRGFNPLHTEVGLGCEACHGPGAAHAKQMTLSAGHVGETGTAIYNPAVLSPSDSIDFCGSCHRSSGDVLQAANKANDSSIVRFQPYRLQKSRCWRATEDERLTCVACHDPHQPLNNNDVSYDKRCLGCHTGDVAADHSGKVCPTGAKAQCVSCHMPKVAVPSMHGEFTDHFIRVAKAGEPFPN